MLDITPSGPLANAAEDGPLNLTEEQTKTALIVINKTMGSLSFMAQLLKEKQAQKSDAQTHLGLLRYNFNDLNDILYGGMFLSEALENTKAQLRQANRQIREMAEASGKAMTHDKGEAFLHHMENTLTAWYELTGFHYCSSELKSTGITLDFHGELNPDSECELTPDTYQKEMDPHVKYAFGPDAGWQLHENDLRIYLDDTDHNKNKILDLFKNTLPGSHVIEFKSRQDRGIWHLGFRVFVPYAAIDATYQTCSADTGPDEKDMKL